MPPKKVAKEEEIDVSQLPPWFPINCGIKFEGKKERYDKLVESLTTNQKNFYKVITRDEIAKHAQEKGLYVDESTLTDKQKKDPNFMATVNLSCTPGVMAKSFKSLQEENDLKGRKAKKDKLDGKEVDSPSKDIKKDDKNKKPDPKKGGKKDEKVEEVKEEVKEEAKIPEKEYKKAFDFLYIILDFPQEKEEVLALAQEGMQIDIIFDVKSKVQLSFEPDMDILDNNQNFDEAFKERMEEFIEGGNQQQSQQQEDGQGGDNEENQEGEVKKPKEVMTEEDKTFTKSTVDFIKMFQQTRTQSDRSSLTRQTVIKDIPYEIDPYAEEETLKAFVDFYLEEICAFSYDIEQFKEWIRDKKQQPLIPSEAAEKARLAEIERLRLEEEAKKKQAEEELEAQQKNQKKPGKDKHEEKPVEEVKPETPPAKEEKVEDKKQQQEPFFEYYKQLNNMSLEKSAPSIILEVLLDELYVEKGAITENVDQKEQEDKNQVQSILDDLDGYLKFKTENALQSYSKSQNLSCQNKNTIFKKIIDEVDEIEQRTFEEKLTNLDVVSERERQIFNKLLFPGIDRYSMPDVPEKSKELRKSEKCQLYPHISCKENEFERRLTITKFEELFKEYEPERENWNFGDRIYMERHNKNTLTQTLFNVMIYEPNIISKYNDKDDSLYLAYYFKNPPGRILRKKWSTDWKVLPNLENWINYFKNNENNLRNETYYDIDYEIIGDLNDRIKYMYPSDNSVMFGQKYQVGENQHYRFKVMKEGVVFGIKEENQQAVFWSQFENGTKFFVELEKPKKDQRPISAEQQDVQEVKNEEQPQENKEENQEEKIENTVPEEVPEEKLQAAFTLTLKNGLINKFLPNGDVFQSYLTQDKRSMVRTYQDIVNPYDLSKPNSEIELKRIISGRGSVIKYMKDGSITILYPNGNTSVYQHGIWITTNNKGLRKARNPKENTEFEHESIPCAKRTDPESKTKIIIRGDQTYMLQYTDNSFYVKHKDGTEMWTSPDRSEIIVQHENYSTVKVLFDESKARTGTLIGAGSADADLGYKSIFERSNDGRVVETYLSDGTKVIGYREKQELPGYNLFKESNIHLVNMEDGSVVKIVDDGELVFVAAVDKITLNALEQKEGIEHYWHQLFCIPEERKSGIFSAELQQRQIWTKDEEGNIFTLRSNGTYEAKIAVSLNVQQGEQDLNVTPPIPDGEYIEEENKFLPQPAKVVPPRLFVINNDNTGYEIFNQEQVSNYQRLRQEDKLSLVFEDFSVKMNGFEDCDSLSYVTKLLNLQERKANQINVTLPRNIDIIPKTEKKKDFPTKDVYLFRNMIRFKEFDEQRREQYKNDMGKFENWKKDQQKLSNEYGIMQKSEEDKNKEFDIQLKIIEGRKTDYTSENYCLCKQNFQLGFFEAEIDTSRLKSGTLNNVDLQRLKSTSHVVYNPIDEDDDDCGHENKKQKVEFKDSNDAKQESSLKVNKKKDHFVQNYFETVEGEAALQQCAELQKDIFNPQLPSKVKTLSLHEVTKKSDADQNASLKESIKSPKEGEYVESPNKQMVSIYPEEQRQEQSQQRTIIIKPSIFTQEDIDQAQKVVQTEQQATNYRLVKTKDFNVYGSSRKQDQKVKVPCLLRTNPKSELNQKYILTDSLTDNRVKISSMANRMYLKAPSINELRNTGSHHAIAQTLDKKNNIDEIENKKNLMITANLNDHLKKDLLIFPVSARFGCLKQKSIYEIIITIKNEDNQAQRITIKQPTEPNRKYIRIKSLEFGPIPQGLNRRIVVTVEANPDLPDKLQDEFQIISKREIYKIPIYAHILDEETYDKLDAEKRQLHQTCLLQNHVQLKYPEQGISKYHEMGESMSSDQLPKLDKDKFKYDYTLNPEFNMGDQQKKKQTKSDDSYQDSLND